MPPSNAEPLAPPPGLTGRPELHPSVMLANNWAYFRIGLEILLDYFNRGNTFVDLLRVQQAARWWCRGYYDASRVPCSRPTTVLAAHPDLFDFSKLSWNRVWWRPSGEIFRADDDGQGVAAGTDEDFGGDSDGEDSDGEGSNGEDPDGEDSDGEGSNGGETEPFSMYQEHTLLDDWEVAAIVGLRDNFFVDLVIAGRIDLRDDRYTRMRGCPVLGTDFLDSPILRFLPEVLMEMAFINPRDIIPLDPAGAED